MNEMLDRDSQWPGMRVLVTGAAGFIGRHLTGRLVAMGADVTAFVRYDSLGEKRLARLPGGLDGAAVKMVAGDLKDVRAVSDAVRRQDVVFHLGALIGIPYSYVHPHDYMQTNALGTAYVLDACREHAVKKLVLTSTSEVYGTARYVPIDEEHPLSYFRAFDLPVALVRPFNTYGPGQSARAVIPTIISQALAGETVRLGALSPRRDLTYVDDTVAGMVRVAAAVESLGEVINLGSGRDISIGELAQRIFTLLHVHPHVQTDEDRVRPDKSEVMRLVADTSKAHRLLDWAPRVGLDEGLSRTIAWIREHRDVVPTDGYKV
jgi:nucleoside-diphosphate-sugar epimerase